MHPSFETATETISEQLKFGRVRSRRLASRLRLSVVVDTLPLPLLRFKSSGATLLKFKSSGATATSATLPRNSYNKVAYATGLNLPFLSQTSTSSRRSYMKHSLRVKITIIFSSIQLNLSLHYDIFVNPAYTYTYY